MVRLGFILKVESPHYLRMDSEEKQGRLLGLSLLGKTTVRAIYGIYTFSSFFLLCFYFNSS